MDPRPGSSWVLLINLHKSYKILVDYIRFILFNYISKEKDYFYNLDSLSLPLTLAPPINRTENLEHTRVDTESPLELAVGRVDTVGEGWRDH